MSFSGGFQNLHAIDQIRATSSVYILIINSCPFLFMSAVDTSDTDTDNAICYQVKLQKQILPSQPFLLCTGI